MVVAPDGCYGGDEEGNGGGPVFSLLLPLCSTVCAFLPSPSLLHSFEHCIHNLFLFFYLFFSHRVGSSHLSTCMFF